MTGEEDNWNFAYDANGMRIERSNGVTTYKYVYDGSQLRQMTVDNHTLWFTYDASGTPLAVTYDGTTFCYLTNLQGDVVAILGNTGTAVVTYTYDAWGNIINTSGRLAQTLGVYNPLRYRGYVYDVETGLYYLQSRYYNPQWGRFISADSIDYLGADGTPLSYNLFAYCGNNPVMGYDPTGKWDWGVFADVLLTLWSGAVAINVGIATTAATGSPSAGLIAGVSTFGTINNVVNAVYYTFIANETASIERNSEKSAYVDRYVTRWERLDYTKQETGEKWYSSNAWRYQSEYSLHMYGWYATGWAYEQDIPVLSEWAYRFRKADIDPDAPDSRPIVAGFSNLWGLIGL